MAIHYFYQSTSNRGLAINFLLEKFNGGVFYFHDDDITLDSQALSSVEEIFSSLQGNAFVGGPLGVTYEVLPADWLMSYLPFSAKGWRLKTAGPVLKRFGGFLGGNWAASVRDLKKVGGFARHLGPGQPLAGQESLVQKKLMAEGVIPFFVPQAVGWHYVPRARCSKRWALVRARRTARGMGFNEQTSVFKLGRLVMGLLFSVILFPTRFFGIWLAQRNQTLFGLKYRYVWHQSMLRGLLDQFLGHYSRS